MRPSFDDEIDNSMSKPINSETASSEHSRDTGENNNNPIVEQTVSRFAQLEAAYQALQNKITENQVLIHYGRDKILTLRKKIRELQGDYSFDEANNENELHQVKVCIQHDSCNALINHAENIREHIYHNSTHAESLISPLRKQVDLLELRVQHVRAIEQLLDYIRTGITLEQNATESDALLETLTQKLATF